MTRASKKRQKSLGPVRPDDADWVSKAAEIATEILTSGNNNESLSVSDADHQRNIDNILKIISEDPLENSGKNKGSTEKERLSVADVFVNIMPFVERLGSEDEKRELVEMIALFSKISDILAPKNAEKIRQYSREFELVRLPSVGKPNAAPEIYRERVDKRESAPTFIQRVYGRWLTGEFTRADLRGLDDSAAMGLKNWERLHGRAEINLPTVIERNDRQLAAIDSETGSASAELSRLRSALLRRQRKPK